MFFDIPRQIHCDDPAQEKLLQIIPALKELDTETIFEGLNFNGWKIWADLPHFGWIATEFIESIGSDSPGYKNFSVFGARLTRERLSDCSVWGIWALRSALEEKPDPRARSHADYGLELNAHIPLAAKWVAVGGERIREMEYELGPSEKGGKLWKGVEGFSTDRRAFWKERFGKIGENEMASEVTRVLAKNTRELMERIDSEYKS